VTDPEDQGRLNFRVLLGALGNGGGMPSDGAQTVSFSMNGNGMSQALTLDAGDDGGHDPLDPATTAYA